MVFSELHPNVEGEWKKTFAEQGYVVLDSVLGASAPEIIGRIQARITAAEEAGDLQEDWNRLGFVLSPKGSVSEGKVQKVQGAALVVPSLLDDIFRLPAVREVVEALSDEPEMDVFGTKVFPMYPGCTSVHWHQDNHFFGTASPHIISCAVYLEPTDMENGALRVIPGSNNEGQVEHGPGEGEWANGEWATVDEGRAVDVACGAGTVVLFNALLLHAAHPNTSASRTRFSVFGHFVPRSLDFEWRGEDFSRGRYEDRHDVRLLPDASL